MKPKWSPFQPFNRAVSAVAEPFLVRAKVNPETAVQFNQFGQVIECATARLLEWQPEEMAPVASAKPEAPDAKESPTVG